MTNIKVCHYRCYKADHRMSMDIYADELGGALDNQTFLIDSFVPESSLEKYHHNNFIMRCLRYVQYPRLVKAQQADIHHVLDHGYAHLHPSFDSGKTCATVHDLIPLLRWKGVIEHAQGVGRKPWLNMRSLSYLTRFDQLVSVSNNTKLDLVHHLKIPEEKVSVIPPVISESFKPVSKEACKIFSAKYQLDPDVKWVMISGNEFYKNHDTALKAFAKVKAEIEEPIHLVKTGRECSEFNRKVEDLGLSDSVKTLFLADFNELPLLYNFVDCLLFPSLYEGFGMPVAEALACGTPAVISDRGSLPEIGGHLLQGNDPFDLDSISNAIALAVLSKKYRSMISKKGPRHVEQYRAEIVASKFSTLYQSMLG